MDISWEALRSTLQESLEAEEELREFILSAAATDNLLCLGRVDLKDQVGVLSDSADWAAILVDDGRTLSQGSVVPMIEFLRATRLYLVGIIGDLPAQGTSFRLLQEICHWRFMDPRGSIHLSFGPARYVPMDIYLTAKQVGEWCLAGQERPPVALQRWPRETQVKIWNQISWYRDLAEVVAARCSLATSEEVAGEDVLLWYQRGRSFSSERALATGLVDQLFGVGEAPKIAVEAVVAQLLRPSSLLA